LPKQERVELRHKVGQFYEVFLDRVSQGRHMSKEEVDAVGQGRVWAGQQALGHKLVDQMGGLRHALEAARDAGHLPADAPIEEHPAVEKSLLEYALGVVGLKAGASMNVAAPRRRPARAVRRGQGAGAHGVGAARGHALTSLAAPMRVALPGGYGAADHRASLIGPRRASTGKPRQGRDTPVAPLGCSAEGGRRGVGADPSL